VAAIIHRARLEIDAHNGGVPEFAPLREQDVDRDPLQQFAAWYLQAQESGLREPAAVAVATSTPDGAPSVRMVLLKRYDERGFVFFTNYESRKGRELEANARAAMLFYWDPLGRQVRIEGPVQRTSAEESAEYVRSRARGSQLSALASPQSHEVPDRDWLEQRVSDLDEQYRDAELPLPAAWGGFTLTPDRYEFWQHRDDRLHDRLIYAPSDGGWALRRLAP
jgi:pyridoxamine 5'-phosphate oxidase